MANRIKKGDQVVVTTGKDKGKQGEVVRVDGDRVVVSNVNLVKRHTKPNPQAGVAGCPCRSGPPAAWPSNNPAASVQLPQRAGVDRGQ